MTVGGLWLFFTVQWIGRGLFYHCQQKGRAAGPLDICFQCTKFQRGSRAQINNRRQQEFRVQQQLLQYPQQVSEYDQGIPQSQTADQDTAP